MMKVILNIPSLDEKKITGKLWVEWLKNLLEENDLMGRFVTKIELQANSQKGVRDERS
jgi:hypothetical protein